jgi:PqqD family protein of HPr-rel-A system
VPDEPRPRQSPALTVRRLGAGKALHDPMTRKTHVLNATAAAIWELCDGETAPSEMIAAVCDLTGQPIEVAAEDITRTLADFERLGLIDQCVEQ